MNFLKNLLFNERQTDLLPIVQKGAAIIDVRNPGEYARGFVPGAINIPLPELEMRMAEILQLKKPIITYCQSGMRSGNAVSILKSKGLEAYNGGGIGAMENLLKMAAA